MVYIVVKRFGDKGGGCRLDFFRSYLIVLNCNFLFIKGDKIYVKRLF